MTENKFQRLKGLKHKLQTARSQDEKNRIQKQIDALIKEIEEEKRKSKEPKQERK